MGGTCNQKGHNKNCQKINRIGSTPVETSRKPKTEMVNQVEKDLKKMKVRNWREKCEDRRLWNEIVRQAKTHQEL
jgi:hypothetical protein